MSRLALRIRIPLFLCLVLPWIATGAVAGEVAFQAHTIEDNLPAASHVRLGDLDGDGDLDAVVLASLIDTVAWLRNADGEGGAWAIEYLSFGAENARSLQLVDLDRDGDQDVLTLAYSDCDILWIENDVDGSGDWEEHCHDNATHISRRNHAADVDGDGDLDVVGCSIIGDAVYWFENDTGDPVTAAWTRRMVDDTFEDASVVYAADADDDGDTDILAAGLFEFNSVFKNVGGGGTTWDLQSLDTSSGPAVEFGVADLDRNGDTDVYAPVEYSNSVLWWSRDPAWTLHYSALFGSPMAADVADIDRDGDPDIATLNQAGDWVVWIENDLDGDGDQDLLGVAENAHDVVWWENLSPHRSRSFAPRTPLSTSLSGAAAVEVLDVDRDGDPDVLGGAYNDSEVRWWENVDGAAGSWAGRGALPFTFSGVSCLTTGDMSGNSRPDLVVGSFLGGSVSWCYFKNEFAGWFQSDINTAFHGVKSVFAADFDGDGDTDVAGAASVDDKVAWWENDGSGNGWAERNLTPAAINPLNGANSVHGADLDGDGDIDLLASGYEADQVRWFESQDYGSSGYTNHLLTGTIERPTCVRAGDVDGDGLPDAVVASDRAGGDTLTWWRNQAGGEFSDAPGVIAHDFRVDHLRLADLDRDGDLDILGTSADHNAVFWWSNLRGDGSAWMRHRLGGSLSGAWGVGLGDLDRDGSLDALATGFLDHSVHWWLATEFFAPQAAVNLLLE